MGILKVGDRVESKMKDSLGRGGVIARVEAKGNRALYEVRWDSGESSVHGNRGVRIEGGSANVTPRKRARRGARADETASVGSESCSQSSSSASSESDSSSDDSERSVSEAADDR